MEKKRSRSVETEETQEVALSGGRAMSAHSSSSSDDPIHPKGVENPEGKWTSLGEDVYPLRIYTDEVCKRLKPSLSDQQLAHRNMILSALDPFIKSFNTGDFEALVDYIQEECDSNVALKADVWKCLGNTRAGLLAFWCLLHEIFPDAIMVILERRLRNTTNSQTLECVEYVCKLAGTRITSHPIEQIFHGMTADRLLVEQISSSDLSTLVSRHLSFVEPRHFKEEDCKLIMEIVLVFNDDALIRDFNISILASTIQL